MRRRRNQWLYSKESRKRVKPVRLTVAQQQQQLHEQQLKLLADAKRTLAASEQRLPITIQEWNHVKLASKKLGVTKLQQLFSQCGDDYCRANKSPSTLAKLDAVQAIIGAPLETAETLLKGTDPIYISPDCKFQAFLESLLSELRDARRRELSQRSFFREIFDWSWKETVLQPLENLTTLIEAVLRNGVWSPSLFPTLTPATFRNRQQYTLRGEHFVVRGADFVSGGFLDHWEAEMRKHAQSEIAMIDAFRRQIWPQLDVVLRGAGLLLGERLSEFVKVEAAIKEFDSKAAQWIAAVLTREFRVENWAQESSIRAGLLPWFGRWPFPQKLVSIMEVSLRRRILQCEAQISKLEVEIAAWNQKEETTAILSRMQSTHEEQRLRAYSEQKALSSTVHSMQEEIERHELEKAAAAAHWGDIRKPARAVRDKIATEVLIGASCPYCGCALGSDWHADHIYPVKLGGLSTIQNMVAVCFQCNSRKSDKTLHEFSDMQQFDYDQIVARLRAMGRRC
jgi:5-methylcytosine-specific restriction endonuclease McrA